MDVTGKEERIIRRALSGWVTAGILSESEQIRLVATLEREKLDWRRLSRYAFWTAMACVLIALGCLFADSYLMAILYSLLTGSDLLRTGVPLLLAIACYSWGFCRQRRETQWRYSTEAILFSGVIFTALMLWQVGDIFDNGSGNVAPLFLLGCAIYGAVGWFGRSSLVWLFFLLMLGSWFGAETGYVSGWGAYWLGMNYPIRFVLFGGILLAVCFLSRRVLSERNLFTVSKVTGLIYLFIALWIMSISGNYTPVSWYRSTHTELLLWALLFAGAAGICIYISLKTNDAMLRGFGLTFLGLNLYTRFFEYFWDSLHKVVFFLLLAVSLVVLGKYAEKLWLAGTK